MEDAATAEELQTLGGATEVPAVEQPEAPSVPRNKPLGVRIRENSWFGKKCVKIFKIFTNTFAMTFLAEWGDR